jgi:hypothetical protein
MKVNVTGAPKLPFISVVFEFVTQIPERHMRQVKPLSVR